MPQINTHAYVLLSELNEIHAVRIPQTNDFMELIKTKRLHFYVNFSFVNCALDSWICDLINDTFK